MKNRILKYCFYGFTFLLLSSCSKSLSVWHLKPEEKLLAKNKIILKDNKSLDKEELRSYIRQKPNRAILFGTWKFGLQWQNLWYRKKSGEPIPGVVLDSALAVRSQRQLEIYLKNQGYYNATVKQSIQPKYFWGLKMFEKQKANVVYSVHAGDPLIINSIGYQIKQNDVVELYRREQKNTTIKKGEILKIEKLEEERLRISELMTNNGYYDFAENFISFNVDSTKGKDSTIVITKIKTPSTGKHKKYNIRNVYVNTTHDPYSANNITTDTTVIKGIYFTSKGPSAFNPWPLYRSIFILPGETYSSKKQSLTFRQFANLQMFGFIKIEFRPAPSDSLGENLLDAHILLQPAKRMSVSAEVMGIYREGFGANGQISFSRKNAFGNSEILNFSISAGVENLKQIDEDDFKLGSNIGPRLSLTVPGLFLMPKLTNNIRKNAFPKTTLSGYYNFQRRARFTRYLTNLSLTYEWNEGSYKKHELSIPDINFSFITKDSKILEELNGFTASQQFKFEDAISAGLKYSFIYNNQSNEKVKNPIFFNAKSWLVGPTAIAASALSLVDRDQDNNAITLANIRYSTFFKAQFDLRKFFNFGRQQIAYRAFGGVGIPLDKDGVIPFDQLYFSGGANSVRGWRQRTLGPGSFLNEENNIDRLGEIKLETSIEYRFPITEILKGALFMDAGNVWTEDRQAEINGKGPDFRWDRFYNELAVSPGIGLRLDFDFFLFRLDAGIPLKQAYNLTTWEPEFNNTQFNFGVGYPF